jgi:alanine dehydrogenase
MKVSEGTNHTKIELDINSHMSVIELALYQLQQSLLSSNSDVKQAKEILEALQSCNPKKDIIIELR